jgi:hypothetical protein
MKWDKIVGVAMNNRKTVIIRFATDGYYTEYRRNKSGKAFYMLNRYNPHRGCIADNDTIGIFDSLRACTEFILKNENK